MVAVAVLVLVTETIVGLLLAGLSIPLLLNKVPPNPWYGFRTRLTLSDPRIWYPVNAWCARWLLWLGVATLVAGLVSLLLPEVWLAGTLLATCALWMMC